MRLFRTYLIAFTIVCISQTAMAQTSSETLKSIIQTDAITAFFDGTFNHLGIRIEESKEMLTLHHEGTSIRVEDGLKPAEVDFVLDLDLTGIENLVKYT